jgi:hypothetical protein
MPIWFVYRSPYDGPLSKHVQRLEGADTLLDWFRSIWRPIPERDKAVAFGQKLLGTYVYSFGYLFTHIAENSLAPPETLEQLHAALEGALYIDEIRSPDDTIQALTDDDDVSLVMYWFTDAFAPAHPERVAFLLRDDWRLPETVGPGGFKQKPSVRLYLPPTRDTKALYLVELDWDTASNLEDLSGAKKFPGLRLPELVPWLLGKTVEESEVLGLFLGTLRKELETILSRGKGLERSFRKTLKEDPADLATWNAYTDWLVDQDRLPAELHLLELALRPRATSKRRLQVAPHCVAQMVQRDEEGEQFEQLFLFDDVWASGNVDLANALLDYAARYNVLDNPDVAGEELAPEE